MIIGLHMCMMVMIVFMSMMLMSLSMIMLAVYIICFSSILFKDLVIRLTSIVFRLALSCSFISGLLSRNLLGVSVGTSFTSLFDRISSECNVST